MIAERRSTYSDISRLIGRNPAYIQQFIKRGTPRRLDEEDRRIIAQFLGISEHLLSGLPLRETESAPPPTRARSIRSEERRVGKEGVSTCRSRGSTYH